MKSYHISRRHQIALIHANPVLLLQAQALVPVDQFAGEGHKPDDIYLFTFLLGVVAASQEDMYKAIAAGQPACLIHPLPDEWVRPANWLPLEKLALKSECESPVIVEIGGLDGERKFIAETLELPPRTRIAAQQVFHSVAYIHAERRPEVRVGIHSPMHGEAYIIPSHGWSNIWVYGMDVWLAGWLTREEFRRRACVLNAGHATFQYSRTRTKNLAIPLTELNPCYPLFRRVKDWASEKAAT
jgi:hypothetical protein